MAGMDSQFIDNYRFLARYNRWFNQRLYVVCDPLGDAVRRQDRGAPSLVQFTTRSTT